jgi:hypothetical protein
LATNEVDYFVYIGYNATDGVTIGFARIPYARTYGDFSATTTNERYAAISTITTAASSDEYEVVGRFNAILSATASFNWSIPGTSIVVCRPVYETRWLTFTPTWTNLTIGNGTVVGKYKIDYNKCVFDEKTTFGTTTSIGGAFPSFVLPFTASAITNGNAGIMHSLFNDLGVENYYGISMLTTAVNSAVMSCIDSAGAYVSETGITSTTPFTFGTSDSMATNGSYQIGGA